jgi:predicted transcriptional regulator
MGSLEERVMAVLWHANVEMSAREVAKAFPDNAYTTVATILDRLVLKGLVTRRSENRKGLFSAVGSADARVASVMHEALAGATESTGVLAAFARSLTKQQAAALRDALDTTADAR